MSKSILKLLNLTKSYNDALDRAMKYLQNSHASPKVESGKNVIPFEENVIDEFMKQEVDRFNRLKKQKQAEALLLYKNQKTKIDVHFRRIQKQKAYEKQMKDQEKKRVIPLPPKLPSHFYLARQD